MSFLGWNGKCGKILFLTHSFQIFFFTVTIKIILQLFYQTIFLSNIKMQFKMNNRNICKKSFKIYYIVFIY